MDIVGYRYNPVRTSYVKLWYFGKSQKVKFIVVFLSLKLPNDLQEEVITEILVIFNYIDI